MNFVFLFKTDILYTPMSGNYMFNMNNRNTKTGCQLGSKLTKS